MEEYLIQPWDTRQSATTPVDWDMHVPPEIDVLAEEVMKHYDMAVSSRTLITSKPDKGGAIWRIETNKGPRSLKLLHRRPERSLFSVGLQEYVVKQGARVPALIPAKDGKLFVEKGGKLWIVTDWIALQPATKVDLVGAEELCYGLGEFHMHTKGYIPPVGAKNSSRLYRWPNYYQKITKKIGWIREVAKAYKDTAASASILSVIDQYEQQAQDAMRRLQESAYARMVAKGEPYWGLVHQDYGWSNGQNGPGGLWVIDLDGVAYDLPFRDLRKLITSTMDDMGVWDITWMRGMIDAYHRANPLDAESFEVLLIDMAMPNEFYKHLKEMFFDPVTFLNTEAEAILQRVVATDQTKWQALAELAKDKSKYAAGAYDQVSVPETPETSEKVQVPSKITWEAKKWILLPQKTAADTVRKKSASADTNKKAASADTSKKAAPVETSKKAASAEISKKAASVESGKKKSEQKSAPVKREAVPAAEKKATVPLVKRKKEEKVKTTEATTKKPTLSTVRDTATIAASIASISKKLERTLSRSPQRSQSMPPEANVIDLLPFLASATRKSKLKRSSTGARTKTGVSSANRKKTTVASRTKRTASSSKTTLRTIRGGVNQPQKAAKKKAVSGRPASRPKQATTSVGKTRKPSAARRHSYSKAAGPQRRVTRNPARRPRAKRGVKTSGGLR
ncbi:CotS family spore coat protein [Brevibacillus panacihumi]|uniref:CotS family spore coat protein n=1 Tax=Brevibacillus panacihumi TaxID=497735 RepID=A0A3M8CLV0_9BACL|nr:CotS family spore coat protein [Brevibacillus panacihumi]RNB76511.1 CotS family spore coat protein [Brevibacillus panacihumi]